MKNIYKDKRGYLFTETPYNKKKYVHREVIEKELGRKLDTREQVHHKNGVKDDNRLENLELLSVSEHSRLHSTKKPRYCLVEGCNGKHYAKDFCHKHYRWKTRDQLLGKTAIEVKKIKIRSMKKRAPVRGEENPVSKLSEKQVEAIRKQYKPRKCTAKMLSRKHSVSSQTIYAIVSRRLWKHI